MTSVPSRAGRSWWDRVRIPFLALLGLNLAVFVLFTLPRLIRERNVAARVEALRAQVGRERDMVAALEQWARTMTQNAEDTRRFYAEVIGTRAENLVPLMNEIQKTARDLGIAAGGVSNKPELIKEAPLVRFEIQMPVRGSYPQLVSFLDRMERSSHFVIVDEVALQESGESGAGLTVQMSTYFRAEAGGSRGR